MTSPTDRIAKVLRTALDEQADVAPYGEGTVDITGPVDLAEVAEQIAAELQLTEEWAMDWWDNGGERHRLDAMPEKDARKHAVEARADRNAKTVRRWVSAWSAVERKP